VNGQGKRKGWETLPRPVAFVFSGGTSLGALQAGMLRAMVEHDLTPDLLVGTSVGAFNAVFMGGGYRRKRVSELTRIWRELETSDIFGHVSFMRLVNLFLAGETLAGQEALRELIRANAPESHEDLAIPVHVVATDLLTGEPVVLSRGPLVEHLLASSAIPFVFPPVTVDGRALVDGSVSAHVPLLLAEKLGARTLVVFDTGYPCKLEKLPATPFESTLHLMSIILHRQPSGILSLLEEQTSVVYPPTPCPVTVPSYDFSQGLRLIHDGYEAAKEFLDRLVLRGPGVYVGA